MQTMHALQHGHQIVEPLWVERLLDWNAVKAFYLFGMVEIYWRGHCAAVLVAPGALGL